MNSSSLSFIERAVLVLIVLSFVEFDCLNMIGLGSLMSLLRVAAAFFAIALFVIRKAKIDSYLLVWLALPSWIVVASLLAEADTTAAFSSLVRIATIALFFYVYRDRFDAVIRTLYVVLGILVLANFITIVAFPDGMYVTGTTNLAYENWLLGFKNKHIVFYLPLLLITLLLYERDGLSVDKVVLAAVIIASSLLTDSSTNLVCMAVMVVLGVIPYFRRRYHVLNASVYMVISLALFMLVVVLRFQEAFSFLIVDLLGKDLSLTNRTVLWDIALVQISERPIFGWGVQSINYLHLLYGSYSVVSPHNQILEYAFQGGIIAVAIFLLINLRIVRLLGKTTSDSYTQIAASAFLAVHVALLTEVYTDSLFYLLYFLIPLAPSLRSEPSQLEKEVKVDAGRTHLCHRTCVQR